MEFFWSMVFGIYWVFVEWMGSDILFDVLGLVMIDGFDFDCCC